MSGATYLRISTALTVVVFIAFMLTPMYVGAVVLLGVMGFLNAGWYSILQARLYMTMPGRSGRVSAVGSLSYSFWAIVPLGVGALATVVGLETAMWVLVVGPVAIFIGLPRESKDDDSG